jgi:hypothetical protein
LLAAFIVYFPETKKPQAPLIEPARGFLVLSTVRCQQTSPRSGKPKKLPNQKEKPANNQH